jgi:hypothetical protein
MKSAQGRTADATEVFYPSAGEVVTTTASTSEIGNEADIRRDATTTLSTHVDVRRQIIIIEPRQ